MIYFLKKSWRTILALLILLLCALNCQAQELRVSNDTIFFKESNKKRIMFIEQYDGDKCVYWEKLTARRNKNYYVLNEWSKAPKGIYFIVLKEERIKIEKL